MRSPLLLLLLFLAGIPVCAQRSAKFGFQLEAFLQRQHAPGTEVDLFLRGPADAVRAAVLQHQGSVKMSTGDLVSARVPVDQVRALAAAPAVQGVEFTLSKGRLMNDSMRVHNRVVPAHLGQAPLQAAYTGKGVILGIIDSGLELDHPDVQDSLGNTRVLKYWDQRYAFDAVLTPQPYGYGQQWDSAQINAGQCPAADQTQFFGHGSTVTGTAAGNGRATGFFTGVAPEADLVIVSSDFNRPNWKASVADAVAYIMAEGTARDMPVVINASLGDYLGSHDGKDAAALFIDSLLQAEPGRVMVCAAGNSGQYPNYHVRNTVTSDTSFTWYKYKATPNAFGYGVVYFDLWADTADLANVHYAIGADRTTPNFRFRGRTPFHTVQDHLGQIGTDTLWSLSGNRLAIVDMFAELRGGQYHLEVHLKQPDSTAYYFRFMATGSGQYDGWTAGFFGLSDMVSSGLPSAAVFPAIQYYKAPDANKRTVDSWACSDQVLTVANYFNETSYVDVNGNTQSVTGTEGAITPASSRGPTRDGRVKPDIGSTGDVTLSMGPLPFLQTLIANEPFKVAPGGMHMRNGGTSMASPVVAGAAALYLEKCPRAPHAEVISALHSTAVSDNFTGAVPNNIFGHGKLDVFAALVQSTPDMSLSLFGDTALCVGDSVLVSGPAFMETYMWNSGDSVKVFYHEQPGPLHLMATNASGCRGLSDTLVFVVNPLPAAPVITQIGNVLESSPAAGYQWFFEGAPMVDETMQQHTVLFNGNYFVQITDTNGCTANSDTLFVLSSGVDEGAFSGPRLWPSPSEGLVQLDLSGMIRGPLVEVRVVDARGRVCMQRAIAPGERMTMDLSSEAKGMYTALLRQGDAQWTLRFTLQ